MNDYYTNEDMLAYPGTLIVPIYEEDPVPAFITEALSCDLRAEIRRTSGALTTVHTLGKMQPNILCFVGMGKKDQISYGAAKHALGCAFYAQKQDCGCWIDAAICDALSPEEAARAAGFASIYSTYRFTKINAPHPKELTVTFFSDAHVEASVKDGIQIAQCVNHARQLGNLPSNYLTPEAFVEEARRLAQELSLSIDVLDRNALREMGAGALLGVNQGSGKGAYLITLTYTNAGDAPYTALVGKGITFDSGGYTLKPRTSMSGMKFDMCGAANALCTLELAARRQAKVNLMAVLAVTENMIGPDAYTVDDVLVSLSGQTIEVTNTDAEGRLILCDALTHASNKQAARIIDLATLTGACITALGERYTGAFTNAEPFLQALSDAAKASGELLWQLPLDEEFRQQLRTSTVADLVNAVPNGKGGSSLAAAFLEAFIPEGVEWIHLDIAGPAETNGSACAAKGATGVMIETLNRLLCS